MSVKNGNCVPLILDVVITTVVDYYKCVHFTSANQIDNLIRPTGIWGFYFIVAYNHSALSGILVRFL